MKTIKNIGLILLMTAVVFNASAQNSKRVVTLNSSCKVQHDISLLKAEAIANETESIVLNAIQDIEGISANIEAVVEGKIYKIQILNNRHIKKGFFFLNDFFENAPAENEMKDNINDDGSFDFLGETFNEMPEENIVEPFVPKSFKFLGEEFPAMPEEQIIL